MEVIRTLIDYKMLQDKVSEVAQKINKDYKDKNPILVCILKGAVYFYTDLTRNLDFDPDLAFMKVSSYKGKESTGKIDIKLDIDQDIKGRDIIIVEDIIDTGISMSLLYDYLLDKEPNSISLCTLLDKPERRKIHDIEPDYVGFTIPDRFVIGYGLDYEERYRTIPNISCITNDNDSELLNDIHKIKAYRREKKNIH